MLAKLPEGNHDQILDKAKLAMEVGDVAESQRLAEALLKQNSGDEEGVRILVQALLRQNKPEDAKKIVDKGLAANSDSQMLRLIKAQLDGNAEELSDAIDKNIDSIKDEYTREVAKFNRAEAKGNDKEAAEHLDKVEKLKPDLPEVWYLRFQYYAKRKQWDALQPYVQKLTAANYDRAGGLIYQFRLAMAKGDTDRAMDLAQQLTIKLPEFAQSFLARGQALQALNKYDEAAENYLRVLEKQATNFEAYRGLVECYYALHKYDAAGRHLAEARKRLPNNTILRQMEIEHELNYGQPEKVIGLLETRAAVRQDKAETWIVLGRAYERIVQRKAAKNDPEASQWAAKLKAHYAKAFDKWPDNTEIAAHYADACLMVNATDEAENALKLLVQKVPDRVEPVLMLAEFYTRVAQPSHAEMVLRDAMRKMPDRQELPNRLSQLLASIGRIDDSLLVLDQMNQPDKVLMAKLEILLQSGRFKDARGVAETAIKKNPDDINLLNAMAYVSLNDNDIQAARRYAEKSLSLKSANPIALYQRALVQMKQSPPDLDAAITDLKQAMLQLPTNVEFHGAAADAYLMRRDPDAAIRELETASKLAPRNRMIWMRLAELYMTSTPPRLEDCRSLVEQVRVAGAGNDPELAGVAARIAAQKQDIPTAISEMRRMVQLSGGSDVAWRSYLFMLLELKQNDLALKEVEELAKSLDLWWIHHVRATAKVRQGARDEAVAEWEKAMTLADKGHDENAAVMIVQGIAREMNVAQAMPLVLAKAKDDLRWMIFAASLYQAQGDMPKAVVMSEQVLASLDKLTPADQTRALQVAGMIYLQSRPAIADKAIKVYRKLLDKTPDDLATLNNLACLYVDNVKPSEPATALEFSQKAYDLMRKQGLSEPLIMDTHGWVLVRTGRYQEGLIMLQEVVQRQPFLEARYHLAEAYIKGNHPDAAVRQLQAAKDMITTAEKNKAVIDPEMRTRVDQAMTRAVAMVKQQSKETGDQ